MLRRLALGMVLAVIATAVAEARPYKVSALYRGTPETESFGFAIAADGDRVLIGAPFEGTTGDRPGAIYYFESGALRHRLEPLPSNGSFGLAVALAGELLVVGSPSELANGIQRGAVRLYDAASGTLVRTISNPSPVPANAGFGAALAVDGGDLLVGGGRNYALDPPADVVYRFALASGDLIGTYHDPAGRGGFGFGASIAVVGDRVVIGSPGWRTSVFESGPGRVYVLDAASGDLASTVENPQPATGEFGGRLAVVGGAVAIGAPNRFASGDGAVHLLDPASGAIVRTLRRSFPGNPDTFGTALAASGAELLVASPRHLSFLPGDVAYVFDVQTGAAESVLLPPPGLSDFGYAVAATGRDLFVYGDEGDVAHSSGAVFRFTPACGDGGLDACESCDDGNTTAGDGCDADCRLETCGDGIRDPGEECDDGNAVAGDVCDPDCSASRCGNCQVSPDEACDDGNDAAGDGCDPGCTATACGNGVATLAEECDDGNTVEGDGCSNACKVERCGNGRVDAGESCDGDTDYPEECVACRRVSPDLDAWKPAFELSVGNVDPLLGRPVLAVTAKYLVAVTRREVSDGQGGLRIDPRAKAFDRETGAEVHDFHVPAPRALALAGDDVLVAEIEPVGRVHRFDGASFAPVRTFDDPTPATGPFGLVMHAIHDRLFVQDVGDAAIHVFDLATGAVAYRLDEPAPAGDPAAFGAVVLDLGDRVGVAGETAVHVFERATGAFVGSLAGPGGAPLVGRAAAVLDGQVLVPDGLGDVHLLNPGSGAVVHTFARPPRRDDRPPVVVVTADDVVIGGFDVVRVFDRNTRALRHTILPLIISPQSCFGAAVAAFDAGLVVGDPCLASVGVFDRTSGAPLSVLRDFAFFDYLRGPHLTWTNTFLVTFEFGDHQWLSARRPCADGVLRPFEECDDGNLVSGDGCDVNCTDTRCGNGVVAAGEVCDPYALPHVEQCSGDCELGACPDALVLTDARVLIRGARPPAGDERLTLSGRLVRASGASIDASPARTGAQILIERDDGTPLVGLTSPVSPLAPGPRGATCGPRDGWRSDAHRDVYLNRSGAVGTCSAGSAQGIRRLEFTRRARGDATVRARFGSTTLDTAPGPLRVRLGVDLAPLDLVAGPCHGSPVADLQCRASPNGDTLDCR